MRIGKSLRWFEEIQSPRTWNNSCRNSQPQFLPSAAVSEVAQLPFRQLKDIELYPRLWGVAKGLQPKKASSFVSLVQISSPFLLIQVGRDENQLSKHL